MIVFVDVFVCEPVLLHSVEEWLKELKMYADSNIKLMLVGNKSDLKFMREVSKEDAIQYAIEQEMAFIETSALDSSNVNFAFESLIRSK